MEWRIDPRNPGEVLACAGLAHLAWRANPKARTGFESNERVRFVAPDLSTELERLGNAMPEDTDDGLRFADIELDWWVDDPETAIFAQLRWCGGVRVGRRVRDYATPKQWWME